LTVARLSPYFWCVLLLALAVLLSVGVGAVAIPPWSVVSLLLSRLPGVRLAADLPEAWTTIVFSIRLPRTLLMLLTGAALGGSGAAYQGVFRNPLADPYLLGIASGAGLGAIVAMTWHWPDSPISFLAVPAASFLGSLVTVALVYSLSRVGQTTPTATLILAGVAIGAFASAVTTFLMLRAGDEMRRAVVWMLGGYALGGWLPVAAMLVYILPGVIVLGILGRPMNVLQFGDDQARQMGLNVERLKLVLIITASLVTAGAVAFSGTIGFVGLVVPHLVRLLWGADYRRLTTLAILLGAGGLLLADIAARTVIAPQELPVGVVTACVGAPFFLYLLRRAKQQAYW
jgi:iron complex transport system permease protein